MIKVIKINYKIILLIIILIILAVGCYLCMKNKNTKSINVNAQVEEQEKIAVSIIMYHSVLKSRSGDYIIHPSEFENDLKYIKENGYQTIVMQDLIDYVYEGKALPSKPIILTFDDGHYNNLGYAVPLLKKYEMRAVISIVGKYTDTYTKSDETNLNYSYLRWKDIKGLIEDGTIEFQNHTYNLHGLNNGRKGCRKKSWESVEEYKKILTEDITKLQNEFKENTGYEPNTFTYPFGAISKASLEIIKDMGFKASLSCISGTNYITKDPDCLYQLKRNNRVTGISISRFLKNK